MLVKKVAVSLSISMIKSSSGTLVELVVLVLPVVFVEFDDASVVSIIISLLLINEYFEKLCLRQKS